MRSRGASARIPEPAGERGHVIDLNDGVTKAIELGPTDVNVLAQAHVNRSTAYVNLARYDEALDDATKAIELRPTDANVLAQAYFVRALTRAGLGQDDEVEADFATACELGLMEACGVGP